MYVVLAKALATGHSYRYLNLPGQPLATHYPPGYPLVLALLWTLVPRFPANLGVFKLANVGFTAVAAVLAFRFARERLKQAKWGAALGAIIGAIALPSLYLTSMVLSEPLFLALLLLVLLLAERLLQREPSVLGAVALGAAIAVLALVRTLGLLAMPAVLICLARQKRWREVQCLTISGAILLGPWVWWVHRFDQFLPETVRGAYGSYTAWAVQSMRAGGVQFVADTIALNASTIYGVIARTFSPIPSTPLDFVLVTIVSALAVAGAIAERRRIRVTVVFLALYFVVVLAWPFPPVRFVANLWALLILLPVSGFRVLWRYASAQPMRRTLRSALSIAGASAVLGLSVLTVQGYRDRAWSGLARFQSERISPKLAWVTRHSQPDEVIASEDEGAIYLYTGRPAVPVYSFTGLQHVVQPTARQDEDALIRLLNLYRPSLIIVGTDQGVAAVDAVQSHASWPLKRVRDIPGSQVYRAAVSPAGVE